MLKYLGVKDHDVCSILSNGSAIIIKLHVYIYIYILCIYGEGDKAMQNNLNFSEEYIIQFV